MIDVKIDIKDFNKLVERLKKDSTVMYLQFEVDGPKLKVRFVEASGQLVTVTIFDESIRQFPTISRTDQL